MPLPGPREAPSSPLESPVCLLGTEVTTALGLIPEDLSHSHGQDSMLSCSKQSLPLPSFSPKAFFCTLFFLQISSALKLLAHQDFFHSVSRNSSSSSSLIKHTPTHIHTEFKGFLVVCCICHHRVPNMSWIFGFCILLLRKKRKGKARQIGYPLLLVCILQ